MKIAAAWTGGLALWIGVLSLVLWLWTSDPLPPALLTGVAVALALVAMYAATAREATGSRTLVSSSLPTVVIVIGIAMALNGLTFGLFLILIGAEVVALGVGGLVLQLRNERRAARR
jgi:tellurite resistance protein TehA-like permease